MLDGNNLELDGWHFTLIDPEHISRLRGLIKYKILGIFSGSSVDAKRKLQTKQNNEQIKHAEQLVMKNNDNKIITPWDPRIANKVKNKKYILENLKINGTYISTIDKYVVKHNYYFLMGDNRDNSQDSRFLNKVGYVPLENLVGKAQYIFFSLENSRFFEFWKWPKAIRYNRIMKKIK